MKKTVMIIPMWCEILNSILACTHKVHRSLRLALSGLSVIFVPKVWVEYRQSVGCDGGVSYSKHDGLTITMFIAVNFV